MQFVAARSQQQSGGESRMNAGSRFGKSSARCDHGLIGGGVDKLDGIHCLRELRRGRLDHVT